MEPHRVSYELPIAVGIVTIVTIAYGIANGVEKQLPRELADKIAPTMREIVAGEYRAMNKSALSGFLEQLSKDGGKQLAIAVFTESDMGEMATKAGNELSNAAKHHRGELMWAIKAEVLS